MFVARLNCCYANSGGNCLNLYSIYKELRDIGPVLLLKGAALFVAVIFGRILIRRIFRVVTSDAMAGAGFPGGAHQWRRVPGAYGARLPAPVPEAAPRRRVGGAWHFAFQDDALRFFPSA